jgi:CRISPR-associated protein (TIGR02584 family)
MTVAQQPHQYQHRILLVTVGMTPQIVTETLYKLAVQNQPAFIPTEVHLITTRQGANSATLALLGVQNNQGEFQKLVRDYNLPDIQFNKDNIHIIKDTEGQFIDDNQSNEHNRIAANFITRKIKQFTSLKDSSLHVSLAGGRKTMSYYAGYALSLYGRSQDRLSHIMVDKAFQNNANFFYPPPEPARIDINNHYYSTDDARIILSDIPFVRMQQHIPNALLEGDEGFNETVEKIQRFSGSPSINISLSEKKLTLNGIPIVLTDMQYAFYVWLCQRKKSEDPDIFFDQTNYIPEYKEVFSHLFGANSAEIDKIDNAHHATEKKDGKLKRFAYQKEYFRPHRTRLEGRIKKQLGNKFAEPFLIKTTEENNSVSYQIALEADAIYITR